MARCRHTGNGSRMPGMLVRGKSENKHWMCGSIVYVIRLSGICIIIIISYRVGSWGTNWSASKWRECKHSSISQCWAGQWKERDYFLEIWCCHPAANIICGPQILRAGLLVVIETDWPYSIKLILLLFSSILSVFYDLLCWLQNCWNKIPNSRYFI